MKKELTLLLRFSGVMAALCLVMALLVPKYAYWKTGFDQELFLDNIESYPALVKKIEQEPHALETAEFKNLLTTTQDFQRNLYEAHKSHSDLQFTIVLIALFWLGVHFFELFKMLKKRNET